MGTSARSGQWSAAVPLSCVRFSRGGTGAVWPATPQTRPIPNAKVALAAAVKVRRRALEQRRRRPHVIYSFRRFRETPTVDGTDGHLLRHPSTPLSASCPRPTSLLPAPAPAPTSSSSSHQCCIDSIPITSAARLDTG